MLKQALLCSALIAAAMATTAGAQQPQPGPGIDDTTAVTGAESRAANNDGAMLDAGRATMAVYDDATRTIYLAEGWNRTDPAELSILVHELVHHLQAGAQLRYECPQEREKLAYAAQERWLGLFNLTLASEFEMDPFTLLVRTRCLG